MGNSSFFSGGSAYVELDPTAVEAFKAEAAASAAAAALSASASASSAATAAATLASKAPYVSPAFSGSPTAPTAPLWSNNSLLATTAYADGVLTLIRANAFNVMDTPFMAKGDCLSFAMTCSIGLGSNSLTAAGGAFQPSDIGKTILIPGAGVAGAALLTTISGRTDGQHITLAATASTPLSLASKTVIYGTDDTAAINSALSSSRTLGKPVHIPTGNYLTTSKTDFAFFGAQVIALSAHVHLQYVGTGTGYSIDGGTFNPSAGIVRCVFGGVYPIHMSGHAGSGDLFYFNNVHWSEINVRVSSTAGKAVTGDQLHLGSPVGSGACVCTNFKIVVAVVSDNIAFTATPTVGLSLNNCYASQFWITIENCGAGGNFAVTLVDSNNNTFLGGGCETNLAGGIFIGATSKRNTLINMDCEDNGTQPCYWINGFHNKLISCLGANTVGGGIRIVGNNNFMDSCEFDTIVLVDTGATDNMFIGGSVAGALSDLGTRTVRWGVSGWADAFIISGTLAVSATSTFSGLMTVSGGLTASSAGGSGLVFTSVDTRTSGATIAMSANFGGLGNPGVYTVGAFPLQFGTNGAANITIASGGAVTFSSTISVVGGQIAFPASQAPSSNVNTLDDYKEGTFTPTIAFGGASTGVTYTTQSGTFTKIGNRVFFELMVVLSSKGSSTGIATIGGLPYTVGTSSPVAVNAQVLAAAAATAMTGITTAASTNVNLQRFATGAITFCPDTDFTNTSNIRVGGSYIV